ncbi:hypothetical protein ANCCAN_26913 [Ancylostoma caninum]|uniref:Peptidase A2 domain-containing protein n=1 Tax=Ancylostoma caninum TaxID=29170 RepID=A0A368F5J9_ANCCA|nr:hypothetical protein ANCCAN_26913 [Ancylostoma caninum]
MNPPERAAAEPREEQMEVGNTNYLWQQMLDQIAHECDCALSTQFRHLSQLKRQRVLAAVQKAVDGAKAVIEDVRKGDLEASEIVNALGTSAERLSIILPDILKDAAQMRALTSKIGCDADQLEKRLQEQEEEIQRLQRQLDNFQVEVPAQRQAERQPRPVRAPRQGKFEGQAWSQAREFVRKVDNTASFQSYVMSECDKKIDWQPSSPIQKLNAWSPTLSQKSSHSQGNGGSSPISSNFSSSCRPASTTHHPSDDLLIALKEVMKSQTIGEVKKYDGKSSLTDFIRALEVKYPKTVWSDADWRDILLNHLEGSARTHASNLPAEVLNSGFNAIVEELRKARRTPCERLKAQADWKDLRKSETESVFDFCCRLRKIAKRMSPNSDCDFEMGSKLYECLSHWKDSYYMLAALDSPDGTVFDEVCKVAQRLERTQEPTTSTATKTWKPQFGRGKEEQRNVQPNQQVVESQQAPQKKAATGEGPRRRGFPQQPRGQPQTTRQRDQPKTAEKHASKANAKKDSSTQPKPTRNTFSTHLKSWCCKIKRVRSAKPNSAYGGPCLCNIEIFGIKAKALIDTGSVITIIPLGLLKRAMEQGADLDNMVTMMGNGSDSQVYDASGNPMSFLMLIAATVSVEGAGTARVQMHIQKSNNDMILIGTNALEALGIHIQIGSGAKEEKQPAEERRKRDSSYPLASAARKDQVRANITSSYRMTIEFHLRYVMSPKDWRQSQQSIEGRSHGSFRKDSR